jgi:hypothetical protein
MATSGDVQVLPLVAGGFVWVGATLIFDGWLRRERRPDLAERLRPFQPSSVADEAQDWLDSGQPLD